MIQVTTRVESPTPTTTDVEGAVDYQAEICLVDEAGHRRRYYGVVTYAPDVNGGLRPVGDSLDCWVGPDLMAAIRTPWVAAHEALVRGIVKSLAGGPGVESFEVEL